MAIPQWCTSADVAVWAPEFADSGGMGGIDSARWDTIIQAATYKVMQQMDNRYGDLAVVVGSVQDALIQWTAVVSARIAMQSANVGGDDSRVGELRKEEVRFATRAATGSLVGIDPTYSPNAGDKVYGVDSLVGDTVTIRQQIYQICYGPGPFGVEGYEWLT